MRCPDARITAVVGLNWGDEGKGRIVDNLAAEADVVVRYHGGANAGHTICTDQGTFSLHTLPSGVFRPGVINIVGPGMAVDIDSFLDEVMLAAGHGTDPGSILLSDAASICFPFHRTLDELEEARLGGGAYGSTRRGISPGYGDRVMKKTLLVRELLDGASLHERLGGAIEWANERLTKIYHADPVKLPELTDWALRMGRQLEPHVVNASTVLTACYESGSSIIAEGQLGALRDLYYGIYPYTTSSNCLAGYAPVGMGLPWARVDQVVGVTKAFASCVGSGPFVTEFEPNQADRLRRRWQEYGATTGRPRRLGAFDAVATRYGVRLQGADEIALTNLDQLSGIGELQVCVGYRLAGHAIRQFPVSPTELERCQPSYQTFEGWDADLGSVRCYHQLPAEARAYVEGIEECLEVPVRYLSVGPHRAALIDRYQAAELRPC
ncbi:MAG: adenylosuccinate synthase [Jatrophihabitantaceae bacterium]